VHIEGEVALVAAAAVLGLLVGSFLNVVIHRVPQGLSVVRPPSACPSCGTPVAPRDNVPLASWLLLRGRARCCGAPVSARYPLVELATGAAFAGVAAWRGPGFDLPAFWYLAAVSVALAVIDVDVHRLPDAIVLRSYPVCAALLTAAALLDGRPGALVRAAVGGVALWALYFVLILVYPAGMGYGDVKLAGILGMYLGYVAWTALPVGAFLGFLAGGLVGGGLMLARRATRKSMIPFGPFMIVGAWAGMLAGPALVRGYLAAVGL
jgi:leader peptidase (prepilin peptidase)/N-methyltransferase